MAEPMAENTSRALFSKEPESEQTPMVTSMTDIDDNDLDNGNKTAEMAFDMVNLNDSRT